MKIFKICSSSDFHIISITQIKFENFLKMLNFRHFGDIHKIDLEALFFRILKWKNVSIFK